MLTQDQIAQQMIAQLRVLDTSISAEIGTPERKIIDTVAQSIAEAGVDLNVIGGSLDIASKFGSDLEAYVGLFGFGRQTGATATGFVTFSRLTAAAYPITIPRSTQVAASTATGTVTFQTSDLVTLTTGNTQVIAPIQALLPGSQGNVAANTITQFANVGAPPLGITAVTNAVPTSGGADQESDAELKVRFKNTVFRNMAGTEDQYLALALSTQYTTKANVIGPISRYQEYFQLPMVNDAQVAGPTATFTGTAANGSPILTSISITTPTASLSSPLSTSAPITSLPVSALAALIPSGTVLTITSGANTQAWVTTATAIIGATAISVTSQTPNFAYPAISTVVVMTGVPMVGNVITGTGFAAGTKIIDIIGTSYTLSNNFTGANGSYSYYTTATGQPPDGSGGYIGSNIQWTTTPSNNPYAKYIYTNIPYFMSNGGLGSGTVFYNSGTDFVMNAPPISLGDTYREFHETPPDIADPATTPNNPNFTVYNVYIGGTTTVQIPTPGQVVLCEYSYMSAESRNDITRNVLNCVDVYVNGSNPVTGNAVIPLPLAAKIFNNNPIDVLYYQNYRRFGQPNVTPAQFNIFQPLFFQPVIGLPSQIVVGNYTYFLGTHYYGVQDWTLLGDTVRARNGIEWNTASGITGSQTVGLNVNGMASGDPIAGPYTGQPITSAGVSSMTVSGYTYDRNIIDLQTAIEASKQVTTDALAHRSRQRYFKLDMTIIYSPGNLPPAINPLIQTSVQNFFNGLYFGTTVLLSDLLMVVLQTIGVNNVRWSNDVLNPSDDLTNTLNRVTECDINGNPLSPAVFFNTDYFLKDNELPSLPTAALATDTVPGLILRPRAENTFNFV